MMYLLQPIVQITEILPGYGDYRNARMTGDLVFDCRLAYNSIINTSYLFWLIIYSIKNIPIDPEM